MAKPKLYSFFSAKGGTGKTALVTTFAFALAARGERVAVLDADFTGTSMADGLALEAPDGAGGHLSLDATRAARLQPDGGGLPFLDAAMAPDAAFDPRAWAWRHPEAPQIAWYPSSPLTAHHQRVRNNVLEPSTAAVAARLAALITAITTAEGGGATVVLVDLGTGIFGVPGAVAAAAALVGANFTALLVSTPDWNDLLRSADIAKMLIFDDQPVRWLLNRNEDAPLEQVVKALRQRIGGGQTHGVWDVLEGFGAHERLRGLYGRDTIGFTPEELRRLGNILLFGGF